MRTCAGDTRCIFEFQPITRGKLFNSVVDSEICWRGPDDSRNLWHCTMTSFKRGRVPGPPGSPWIHHCNLPMASFQLTFSTYFNNLHRNIQKKWCSKLIQIKRVSLSQLTHGIIDSSYSWKYTWTWLVSFTVFIHGASVSNFRTVGCWNGKKKKQQNDTIKVQAGVSLVEAVESKFQVVVRY